jgi:inosose dehydratase
MKLGYCTITWGGVVGHPVGVTSVKDLYYLAHGSTERAVADIAAAGYSGVELFDGNLVEYAGRRDEFRSLLSRHGLELVAVYSGANFIFSEILPEELWRIEQAAELAADLGAEHLVIGGGAKRAAGEAPDDLDRLAAGLAGAQAIAGRFGLTPSYHPHLGTIVETPQALDAIMERTDIGLCPDLAHLAAGGGDPAAIIRRYGDRIPYVHLKDLAREDLSFTPLGAGDLDLEDVLAALDETGYDGWLTVELDATDGDPADAARESAAFLSARGRT